MMKKSKKALAPVYTAGDVRRLLPSNSKHEDSPSYVLEEAAKALTKLSNNPSPDEENQAYKTLGEASAILDLDTRSLTATIFSKKFRAFAIELSSQLVTEYECKTASEKALANLAASAYIRYLEYADLFSANATGGGKPFTQERNGYYTAMGKEVDRASRQFITALTTLRQLKSPSLTVNVKTKAAFIAQNQQINAEKPEGKNEIN